ncbi:MAG: carboxypeptidase regulatory-like domain-containing protein [Acidobacteria bacterium]|nr:carboxypeptidase regulatory-like domain-containing protein [Acidobacteriota bacterium]
MRSRILCLLAGAVLIFGTSGLFAQTGQISGSVRDASGAVVPDAPVVVTNQETGVRNPVKTNSAGEFIVPALTAGNYEVSSEATGFQKATQGDIVLQVGGKVRVELTLQVAAATTTVEVTGTLTAVETETAAISDVVTGSQILNLALPARNFVALALLVPGAAPTNGLMTDRVGVLGNVEISFNGGRTVYNTWEIDGGNNSDRGSNSTPNTYPSLDSIGEFRVSTSNYGADIGQHSGAHIQVSTKPGTRDFHGSVYEFLRNDKLNAINFFTNRATLEGQPERNPHKRNEYGYTIGGPFYIPGTYNTNKDKTFFFWSQAWRKFRDSEVVSRSVPTLRQRQGDFSECLAGHSNFNQGLVDAGCSFPDNADPVTGLLPSLDSNGVELMDAFIPLPNSGAYNYISSASTPVNWRQEQIRVDHNFSDRTRLFVRYTQDAWDTLTPNALWAWSDFDTVKTQFGGPGKSAVLNFAHSFTPSLFSEFIMGYTVDHIDLRVEPGPTSVSGSLTRSAGFDAPHIFPANDGDPYLPSLAVCGGSQMCNAQTWWFAYGPYNSNPIITWKQNLTWIKGTHTLKFGAYVERFRKNEAFGGTTQGYATFASWGANTTGNAVADMLSGILESYYEGAKVGKGYYRSTNFEPYIQDDWKVTRNLTLNLGVRYYLFTRNRERYFQHSGFYPDRFDPARAPLRDADGFLIPGSGDIFTPDGTFTFGNGLVQCGVTMGVPTACQQGEYKNIAPRVGFAWDPWGDGKTAIRAAAGVFYDGLNGNEAGAEATQGGAPFAYTSSLANPDSWAAIGLGGGNIAPVGIETISKTAKFPRTYQWNFNIQRQFTPNDLLTVAYVGSAGNYLTLEHNINLVPLGLPHAIQDQIIDGADTYPYLPFQGFRGITVTDQIARSNYNSLQVSFRHQMASGLNFGTAYTWSHAIDNAGSQYDRQDLDEYNLFRWRGNSSLDRRHILVLNYTYDLPFFKDSPGWLKNSLGGWQVSGITTFMTGTPLNIGCGLAGLETGVGGGVKCNTTGEQSGQSIVQHDEYGPTVQWFNVNAFTQPELEQLYADNQPGMFGYGGRNTVIGPGRNNWDLSLFKNFSITEQAKLQFRVETFNSFNHTQWRDVNTGCSDTVGPGEVCGTAGHFGEVTSAWSPRIIQLGLKLTF